MSNRNRLFYGDNLEVLRRKIASESVDLCYIDPPFNSKRNYFQIYNNQGGEDTAQAQAFVDTWEWGDEADAGLAYILDINNLNSGKLTEQTVALIRGLHEVLKQGALFAYIVHMTLRIVEIHRVLKKTGSFYLHCDPTASHYLKLVCDAIFCAQSGDFKNEIIWKRTTAHSDGNRCGRIHDTILFYTKSNIYTWNDIYQPYEQEYIDKYYRYVDSDGRKYASQDVAAAGPGPARYFNGVLREPPQNSHWRYSQDKIDQYIKEGRIFFTKNGFPRFKRYLEDMPGMVAQDIWADKGVQPVVSWSSEGLGYPTQKPEGLLERIIKASSNEGDAVLDAYCGCGTAVAVAQRLNRQWIGIDITYQSISLILKRLADQYKEQWDKIEPTIQLDGVPRDMKSAVALANRKDDKTRKEFEKWAVLTWSRNQARINEKKGGDGGVDGIAHFLANRDNSGKDTLGKIIISVKSDKIVQPGYVDQLAGTMARESAELGVLLCLNQPSDGVYKRARAYGKYTHPLLDREYDSLKIVTIEEVLGGVRMELPMVRDAVKSAKSVSADQYDLI